MDRTRWLLFGAVLVAAFVASAALGAWIGGRQRIDTPVAAVATPTPVPTPTLAPSPIPPTPTSPPTAPASVPPPTIEPAASLDPGTAEDFAGDLLAAFQTGNTQYLADRLHPVVFERYGEQQCRDHVATFSADPAANWTVNSTSGPAVWLWETDNLATPISDAWTVTVAETGGPRDLHFAPSDRAWRWFLDCGEPHT